MYIVDHQLFNGPSPDIEAIGEIRAGGETAGDVGSVDREIEDHGGNQEYGGENEEMQPGCGETEEEDGDGPPVPDDNLITIVVAEVAEEEYGAEPINPVDEAAADEDKQQEEGGEEED